MFDTVVLLTGPAEQPVLGGALVGHNPRLRLRRAGSMQELTALSAEELARARLVAFATPVIVPTGILDRLGFGAYNFHPGPPEFPGLSPAQFAVYRRSRQFGATAHVMTARVDEGPIVDVARFDVPPDISVPDLELRSYRELARLFWRLSRALATQADPLSPIAERWSGEKSSRRSYAELCDIPQTISAEELERRMAAFGGGYFGIAPTITLHGHRFRLVPETAPADSQANGEGARVTPVPAG